MPSILTRPASPRHASRGLLTARPALRSFVLLVVALIAPVVLHLLRGHIVAVVLCVLLMLTVPGAGVMVATSRRTLPFPVVNMLLVSICWSTVVGLIGAWLTWQSPVGFSVLIAAPGAVGAVVALVRPPDDTNRSCPAAASTIEPRLVIVGVTLVLVGVATYVVAVVEGRHRTLGPYGLLPVVGPWFVVSVAAAVLLVLLGTGARKESRSVGGAMIGVGLLFLIVQFSVTSSFFTDYFIGGWDYKHLGIVDLIRLGQPLSDPRDAFQQWPGFFAVAAALVTVTGVDPLGYANYAGFVFLVLATIGLYAAALTLNCRRTTAALGCMGFLCTMWAGQIYYAPQTMALAMVMLMQVLFVRLIRGLPVGRPLWPLSGRLRPLATRLGRGRPAPLPLEARATYGLIACLTFAQLVLVVTHQLSPYVVLLQFAPFVLLGWLSGKWWVWYGAMVVATIVWFLLHFSQMTTIDSVLGGFSLSNAGTMITWVTSPQQRLASLAARTVALSVWGLTVVVVVSYYRRLGRVLAMVMFAFMPFSLVVLGNYGGELINRIWIFSAPWCVVLLAQRLVDLPRLRRTVWVPATAFVSVVAFLASAQSIEFGMFPFLRIDSAEVTAARWVMDHSPPGTIVLEATNAFPGRMTARYAQQNPLGGVNNPALPEYPYLLYRLRGGMNASSLADAVREEFGPTVRLVVSDSTVRSNDYFRYFPGQTMTMLRYGLAHSPAWRLLFQNSAAIVVSPR